MGKRKQSSAWLYLMMGIWIAGMAAILLPCWYAGYLSRYGSALNREARIVALLAYAGTLLCMLRSYSALKIGWTRVSELVFSQMISCTIAAVVLYGLVSIYAHAFAVLLPLLAMLAGQLFFSVVWTLCANSLHSRKCPPVKTVIVYGRESDLHRLHAIRYFDNHFEVIRTMQEPEPDKRRFLAALDGCEAVLCAGVDERIQNWIAKYCVERHVEAYIVPHLGDIILSGAERLSNLGLPVLRVPKERPAFCYPAVKRLMDVALSLTALVIASPLMLLTAAAIRCYDRGPVFYRQTRLTQDGRQFSIIKFRSMRTDAERDGVARLASVHDDRITPVGRFIRATRIDELPQLLNILAGDMSIHKITNICNFLQFIF